MGGTKDIVKGRVEEAAGALTGSEQLRNKGRTDQQIGEAEQVIEKIAARAQEAVGNIVASAKNAAAYAGK